MSRDIRLNLHARTDRIEFRFRWKCLWCEPLSSFKLSTFLHPSRIYISLYQFSYYQSVSSSIISGSSTQRLQKTPVILQKHVWKTTTSRCSWNVYFSYIDTIHYINLENKKIQKICVPSSTFFLVKRVFIEN